MQTRFGLLDTDVMPIFMIIALDIVIIMRFYINCSVELCSPTVIFSILREASSETFGPGVYFYHIIFSPIKPKTQKYLAAINLPLFYFAVLLIFYTYLYQISSLQVTVKGMATPLSRWVQVFVSLCRRNHW